MVQIEDFRNAFGIEHIQDIYFNINDIVYCSVHHVVFSTKTDVVLQRNCGISDQHGGDTNDCDYIND